MANFYEEILPITRSKEFEDFSKKFTQHFSKLEAILTSSLHVCEPYKFAKIDKSFYENQIYEKFDKVPESLKVLIFANLCSNLITKCQPDLEIESKVFNDERVKFTLENIIQDKSKTQRKLLVNFQDCNLIFTWSNNSLTLRSAKSEKQEVNELVQSSLIFILLKALTNPIDLIHSRPFYLPGATTEPELDYHLSRLPLKNMEDYPFKTNVIMENQIHMLIPTLLTFNRVPGYLYDREIRNLSTSLLTIARVTIAKNGEIKYVSISNPLSTDPELVDFVEMYYNDGYKSNLITSQ